MRKINKKAEERWLTPWMFFVWFLVGIAIVVAVGVFYLSSIDSRGYESESLGNKILSCFIDSGNIKPELFQDSDVFANCGLDKKIISDNGLFYFNVSVYSSSEKRYIWSISGGNREFEINCFLPGDSMPKCEKTRAYALCAGEGYILEVLTGSNQVGGKL